MRATLVTTLAVVIAAAVILPGCGNTEVETPEACLESPAQIAAALRNAPEAVVLDEDTKLSDCLVRNQPEGDLVNFGTNITEVASGLGAAASEPGPDGLKAAIDAGYLVGALERGAENSEGIHATLVERVKAAATNGLARASKIKRAHYEAGLEAGHETG